MTIVNSVSLSDFVGTNLSDYLEKFSGQPIRVGLVGVWTDAQLLFLTYELKARFPSIQLAVCSALTASSSKANHYIALEQMQRLFEVKVFSSIGEFTNFLAGTEVDVGLPGVNETGYPKINFGEENIEVTPTDLMIIRYLFRDSRSATLKTLTGGYSGNLVLSSESEDIHGHSEVPHVIKIGKQDEVGKERISFEKIESVMGNNAPRIVDFVDFKGRGALKYRYAAMGGGISNTFQKLYMSGVKQEKAEAMLNSDAVPIDPQRMCRELRDWLEALDDPIVIGDGGDIVATAAKILPVKREGAWMDPGPLGTLGVGMPFALAAHLRSRTGAW